MTVMTVGQALERWPEAAGMTPWQDCWRWYCPTHRVVAFSESDYGQMMREHRKCVPIQQNPKKWLEGEPQRPGGVT